MKITILTLAVALTAGALFAASPWHESLANAIYRAEGGAKTKHPYGILAKDKTTTPRQACINTINSNLRRWKVAGKPGNFIDFMARSYCPVGAANDPTGLNQNWPRNVKRFMTSEGQPHNPPAEVLK